MEDLRSDLIKGSRGIVEDDEFYEDIEAPKFVDFIAPDRSRPDDGSWFCVRIGCDQQHEQVDPDALHKSFKLRVMAARSPNIRVRKALNRQDSKLIPTCPHSAPAKPMKDRISRLSTITSIPEKATKTNIKDHPISRLRSTPNHEKTQGLSITSKKALTTPRNKKCPTNQKPFRSVKYQKAPVAAPKDRSVAKALVFHTPKKTAESTTIAATTTSTPMSMVCAEMKKLKIDSMKKLTPRGRLCNSSRCAAYGPNCSILGSQKGEETAKSLKEKTEGHSVPQAVCHDNAEIEGKLRKFSISTTNVEEQFPSSTGSNITKSAQSLVEDSTGSHNPSRLTNSEDNVENTSHRSTETETATHSDDNKENVTENYSTRPDARDVKLNSTSPKSENLQFETREDFTLPQKAGRAPSKTYLENPAHGGKHKRTTNPKPFRLRTDERGILREANLERRHHQEVQKESASALRCRDGMQDNQIGSDKGLQKALPIGARTPRAKLVRFAGVKLATSSPQRQKSENNKEKLIGKSQNKTVKVVSSRYLLKTQSVMATRKIAGSQLHRGNGATANVAHLHGKKLATIPKEPNYHKTHIPKGCTKRSDVTNS